MITIRGFTGWLFFMLIIVALLVFSNQLHAQGDHKCQGGHNCNDDSSIVETIIGGDSTKALGLGTGSLGVAAIGNCIATTQFSLFIIFKNQKVKLDTWCAAEYLDRQGKHQEAALMRCSDPAVSKIYGEQNCEAAMTTSGHGPSKDDDVRYMLQQEEIEYLREDNASIVGRLEALTERLEQRPATVPAQVQTQIKRQESDAEQRRVRAKEAYLKALEGSE